MLFVSISCFSSLNTTTTVIFAEKFQTEMLANTTKLRYNLSRAHWYVSMTMTLKLSMTTVVCCPLSIGSIA